MLKSYLKSIPVPGWLFILFITQLRQKTQILLIDSSGFFKEFPCFVLSHLSYLRSGKLMIFFPLSIGECLSKASSSKAIELGVNWMPPKTLILFKEHIVFILYLMGLPVLQNSFFSPQTSKLACFPSAPPHFSGLSEHLAWRRTLSILQVS